MQRNKTGATWVSQKQQQNRKLYKGPKIIAGVCSGVAQYFNIDAVIVRIIWVLLCIFSLGIGLALYIVLAIVMPEPPKTEKVVDCTPISVQSDKYCNVAHCSSAADRTSSGPVGVNAGAGHIPPTPPQGFSEGKAKEQAASSTSAFESEGTIYSTVAYSTSEESEAQTAKKQSPAYPANAAGGTRASQDTSSAQLALILGLCLVAFFGVCAWAFTRMLPGVSVIDLFPVLFVALGIVIIAIPTERWSFSLRICGFLFCLELCLFLLPFTLGIVSLGSMVTIGPLACVCWAVTAGLIIMSLVSSNQNIVFALIGMFFIALVATFIDIGVLERALALITLGPPHKNSIGAYTVVYTMRPALMG